MIRVYLTPFDDLGELGAEVEITADVDKSSLGKIKRALDSSQYDIGVLRYNSLNLKLQNWHGRYSDVDDLKSVFRFRRSGSRVRVTWAPAPPAICGVAVCGETILAEEIDLYEGILNDETSAMDIDDQVISFPVLSFDSQFSRIAVPFESLDLSDTLEEILFKILDQSEVTRYLTVDSLNLSLEVNYAPDSLEWFENKTGKEAIEKLLLAGNSVLYIEGGALKTRGRSPAEDVALSFYGQASELGNENITGIGNFRNGQNRIINFVRWKDGASTRNLPSIDLWGVRLKEIDIDFITNPTKQALSGASIVDEFKSPKKEFRLETLLSADSLAVGFLDRVDIDYPSIVELTGKYLPKIGLTKIGDTESPLPYPLWNFTLSQDQHFKVMGIEMDLKEEKLSFELRGI